MLLRGKAKSEESGWNLDFDDEITRGSCITHDGRVVNERVEALLA